MEPNNIPEVKSTFFHSIKKWSLVLAIVIVSNIFFSYAISLVYPAPKYEDYCVQKQVNAAINDEIACTSLGGQWNAYPQKDLNSGTIGYCNEQFTCSKNYEDTRIVYERNVFIALAVIGVALLVVGLLTSVGGSILTLALSWAGVLSLVIASIRYWSYATNLLQVIILFLALAALIYVAVKKFKN
ncbi:MAG: hypothetical protein WAV11_02310 [Minisyncoccia bacterium]